MQTSSLRRKYAADFEQDKRFAPIITRAPLIDRQLTKGVRNGRNPCKYKGFDQTVNFFAPPLTHRDDLGRVVVPKEIRRTLRIREGDPLEIFTDREGEIILKKYSPIGELSLFAKQFAESMAQTTGHIAVIADRDQFIAMAGTAKKELLAKSVSRELETLMSDRESIVAAKGEKGYIPVSQESDDYEQQVIAPIISEGDVIGAVMILSKDKKERFGNMELKIAGTAAAFLGRQMEQ